MKKNFTLIRLIDLYGALLSDRQREIVSGYYEYDLSLAELSEQTSISRQGVRDALNKAVALLNDYESKLHLLEKETKKED